MTILKEILYIDNPETLPDNACEVEGQLATSSSSSIKKNLDATGVSSVGRRTRAKYLHRFEDETLLDKASLSLSADLSTISSEGIK